MNTNALLYPGYTLLISITATIIIGTFLLLLPISQVVPVSFIDCLFASVASTCVAGCLTVPFNDFTVFGKSVILGLIQVGGIGLITLSLFLISLFTKLGYRTQLMIGQILEFDSWKKVKPMLMFIIFFTLIVEALGALGIFYTLYPQYDFRSAVLHSIFHSISSFCSAGLSSFDNNLVDFSLNLPFLSITGLLIILGTFGFLTWLEIFQYISNWIRSKRAVLSLSTQIILVLSTITIFVVTIMLLLLESGSQFVSQPLYVKFYNMLFNAISYRSTGFTTLSLSSMSMATLFMVLVYSFIGSAPGSTGSGIKITTFGIFLATLRAILHGKMTVEITERRIMQEQVFNTMAIIYVSLTWIILATFLLLIIETDYSFFTLFFEVVSSFTTLGMGIELTPTFSVMGKLLIILNIFIGRVGILIMLLALKSHKESEFNYPEERIMIT